MICFAPAALKLSDINANGAAAPNQTLVIWCCFKILAAFLLMRGVGSNILARSRITSTPCFSNNCLSNSAAPGWEDV